MPRPACKKNIGFLPRFLRFKPAGIRLSELEETVMGHDEMEAMRLKDLEGLDQEEAARSMDVSQPTFHRLIQAAHRKVADALVNGKSLRIEGGNIHFTEQSLPPCGGTEKRCQEGWKKIKSSAQHRPDTHRVEPPRIAITSVDGTMDGMVDERFGRCEKIVLVDHDGQVVEILDNSRNKNSSRGSGIQASLNVVNSGAHVLISGHLGPNAFHVLRDAGIRVYTVSNMTVATAVEAFKDGKLAPLAGPDVPGHWSTKKSK